MSDYSTPPSVVLGFGSQGCWKTGYAFHYMLNAGAVCNFIFDDLGQAQKRLRLRPCNTERECELALPGRWVCFNPHVMFKECPERNVTASQAVANALAWFATWARNVSKRGPGRKIFFADETWQHMDARGAPPEVENIARTGRWDDLELYLATHRPSEYPRNIRALVTEWVCGPTIDPLDLDAVRPYFAGVDRCRTLPKGTFIVYSREHGTEKTVKCW